MATFNSNADAQARRFTAPTIASSIANGGAEDPANPFTDDTVNGVITGGLLGGTATPDPGDARWWVWPLLGQGTHMTGAMLFTVFLETWEFTAPPLSDDVYAFCGVINETSPNTGTVEGFFLAFQYTGGTRRAAVITLVNGVATTTVDAGPAGLMRRLQLSTTRTGPPLGNFYRQVSGGKGDDGVYVGAPYDAADVGTNVSVGSGLLYWCAGFGRTSADADAVIIAHTPLVDCSGRTPGDFAPSRFG